MNENSEFVKWLLTVAVIPGVALVGKWLMSFWERERERVIAVQDAAGSRAEKAHQEVVAALKEIVATCRDERVEALRVNREQQEGFTAILDGAFREHNETSREIAKSVSELRAEIMRSRMEGRVP